MLENLKRLPSLSVSRWKLGMGRNNGLSGEGSGLGLTSCAEADWAISNTNKVNQVSRTAPGIIPTPQGVLGYINRFA